MPDHTDRPSVDVTHLHDENSRIYRGIRLDEVSMKRGADSPSGDAVVGKGLAVALLRGLATVALWALVVAGILAIPVGAFLGSDSPFDGAPIPMAELVQRRTVGKAVMFTGGGVAAAAAFVLYGLDRAVEGGLRGRDRPGSP